MDDPFFLSDEWNFAEFWDAAEVEWATPSAPISLAQEWDVASELVEKLGAVAVDELKLSPRPYNGLRRRGIDTVGALLATSENELGNIRNLGRNAIEEIKRKARDFVDHTSVHFALPVESTTSHQTHEPSSAPVVAPVVAAALEVAPAITDWEQLKPLVLRPASPLFWSVPAFLAAWRELGENAGDEKCALQQRRALVQNLKGAREFTWDALRDECRALCSEREWEVLVARCGLDGEIEGEPQTHTLQEIAVLQDVSRERVRQLEGTAQRKIRRSIGPLQAMRETLLWLVERAGGIICTEHAVVDLVEFFPRGQMPVEPLLKLLLQVAHKFQPVTRPSMTQLHGALAPTGSAIFALERRNDFKPVIEMAQRLWSQRDTTLHSEDWVPQIAAALGAELFFFSPPWIGACLRADGRFDPARFAVVAPRLTLEKALVETLQRLGAPTHFTELTARLNEFDIWKREAKTRSVHGRLGAHPELFVCVGRGTYGLAAWGLEAQRVTRDLSVFIGDAAEEFLEARGEAASEDEIVAYVMQRKKCRDFSVRQRLFYDPRFHRFAPRRYGLKKWVF